MANYEHLNGLSVTKKDGIAVVTLNRPDRLNAIDEELHSNLEHVWPILAEDEDVNIIILTGAGRAFSAGGDIKRMIERHGTPEASKRANGLSVGSKNLVGGMLDVHKPIICAVNGDALGLGTTLALLCDITVVSETAKMGDTHVRVGLVAGDGGSTIWPLLIGVNRAKEFLMRGRVVNGKKAEELGIVNHAVPAEQVMDEAMKIAKELNGLPPLAVQWSKVTTNQILKQQFNLAFDSGIGFEGLSMLSADHLEACKAFVEKRKPVYQGR
jgi:enoyl-CoA hydratase/carnithine racemase